MQKNIAIDEKRKQTLLQEIVQRQCSNTIKIVAEACHYFRSVFPNSKDTKLNSLIKRYRQMVIYASTLIVENLLSIEEPSDNRLVKASEIPRAFGKRDQKHNWLAGNELLKTLREIAYSLFDNVIFLEKLILFPTKEEKESMFPPDREPLNYTPDNFVYHFEYLLNQIELKISGSKIVINQETDMEAAHSQRRENAQKARNAPDSTFNKVRRLDELYKRSNWKKVKRVAEIAKECNITERQVYNLLSKDSEK
jgi:hypothetical protein